MLYSYINRSRCLLVEVQGLGLQKIDLEPSQIILTKEHHAIWSTLALDYNVSYEKINNLDIISADIKNNKEYILMCRVLTVLFSLDFPVLPPTLRFHNSCGQIEEMLSCNLRAVTLYKEWISGHIEGNESVILALLNICEQLSETNSGDIPVFRMYQNVISCANQLTAVLNSSLDRLGYKSRKDLLTKSSPELNIWLTAHNFPKYTPSLLADLKLVADIRNDYVHEALYALYPDQAIISPDFKETLNTHSNLLRCSWGLVELVRICLWYLLFKDYKGSLQESIFIDLPIPLG